MTGSAARIVGRGMNHYFVTVEAHTEGTVVYRLDSLHVEAPDPGETPHSFALNLLIDQWDRVVRHTNVMRAFEDNLTALEAGPESSRPDPLLSTLHQLSVGVERTVSLETFLRCLREGHHDGQRARAVKRGSETEPRYVLQIQRSPAALAALAPEHVQELSLQPLGVYATNGVGDDVLAWRLFARYVPATLARFLVVGMRWHTAVYG